MILKMGMSQCPQPTLHLWQLMTVKLASILLVKQPEDACRAGYGVDLLPSVKVRCISKIWPPTIGKARDMGLDRHCQFSVFTSASHLSLYKLLCCLFPYWPFQCFHCRSVHERLALILLVTALCCIASHNPEFSPYHLLYSLKDAEVSHLKPSHYILEA